MTPTKTRKPRKVVESYATWMARIDREAESAVKTIERDPPCYAELNPAQKRIVEMLVMHIRGLSPLAEDENAFGKYEYEHINAILTQLFEARFIGWSTWPRTKDGYRDLDKLPAGQKELCMWLLNNCGTTPKREEPITIRVTRNGR